MGPFHDEAAGLITCGSTSLSERDVYAAFQAEFGGDVRALTAEAKILFKVRQPATHRTLATTSGVPAAGTAGARRRRALTKELARVQVSIDDNTPLKPGQKHALVYAGIPHTAKLSQLLALFNKKYCKGANQEGAPNALPEPARWPFL